MCDVKKVLVENMGYIVRSIVSAVDEGSVLDAMYEIVEQNIDINFDSSHFYFFNYNTMGTTRVKFKIDMDETPKGILLMLIDLIENHRMDENIKNKLYNIHFRKLKDKVYLEDKHNTIRISMWRNLQTYYKEDIRVYLINKLTSIQNKIKNSSDDEKVTQKVFEYRCKMILNALN